MADTTLNPETVEVPNPEDAPETPDTNQTDTTDWKAEARKWEVRAKENRDAAARLAELDAKFTVLAKALTGEETPAETVDADKITADLAAQRRENAVLRAGAALHLDTDALLDSHRFTTGLADIDPSNGDAVKAYLNEFVEANPQYAPAEARTYNPGDGAPQRVPANHPAANVTGTDRMAAALAHQHQNRSTNH